MSRPRTTGNCDQCNRRAFLALLPGSDSSVCWRCYAAWRKNQPTLPAPVDGEWQALPMLDEYIRSAEGIARLVREMFDHPGTVKRPDLLKALEEFERCDYQAM